METCPVFRDFKLDERVGGGTDGANPPHNHSPLGHAPPGRKYILWGVLAEIQVTHVFT